MKAPGLEVGALFRRVESDVFQETAGLQSPELSISMVPDYYMNQSETDQTVWARVRAFPDAEALKAFLARYPDSFYAPDAAARLDLIESQTGARDEAQIARMSGQNDQRLKAQKAEAAAEVAKFREQELTASLTAAEGEKARLQDELAKAAKDLASAQEQAGQTAGTGAKAAADAKAEAKGEQVDDLRRRIDELEAKTPDARRDSQANKAGQPAAPQVALANPAAVAPPQADVPATTMLPQIRVQLRRLGCYDGGDLGWNAPPLRLGVAKYLRYANLSKAVPSPDQQLLDDMKARRAGLCPPECSAGEVLIGGQCVVRTCPAGATLTRAGRCALKPTPIQHEASATRSARPAAPDEDVPEPRHHAHAGAAGHCFSFNGNQYCE